MDQLSFTSWNVRGTINALNRLNVRSLVMESKPSILCLQETKNAQWTDRMIYSLGMGSYIDKLEVQPQGLSGGLLCVWRKDLISVNASKSSSNWI